MFYNPIITSEYFSESVCLGCNHSKCFSASRPTPSGKTEKPEGLELGSLFPQVGQALVKSSTLKASCC